MAIVLSIQAKFALSRSGIDYSGRTIFGDAKRDSAAELITLKREFEYFAGVLIAQH